MAVLQAAAALHYRVHKTGPAQQLAVCKKGEVIYRPIPLSQLDRNSECIKLKAMFPYDLPLSTHRIYHEKTWEP